MAPKRLNKQTKKTDKPNKITKKAGNFGTAKVEVPAVTQRMKYLARMKEDDTFFGARKVVGYKELSKPVWEPEPEQIPKRKYHNRAKHPEFQDILLIAGYHSAHMKQLEIVEELQRALIDVTIAGLPEPAKTRMSKKYRGLI